MNLTRAASLALGSGRQVLSVGRVQTPTLALVVNRDRLIEAFVPRAYYELSAKILAADAAPFTLKHKRPTEPDDLRIYDKMIAQQLSNELAGFTGNLQIERKRKQSRPPDLFTLASLQKACNAKFGWPATKTLSMAQSLYETHKVTTYPRTDCKYLPDSQEEDIDTILGHLAQLEVFRQVLPLAEITIRRQIFNTEKVNQSAHHAIIPTTVCANDASLSSDEHKAYELIASHYIAGLAPDYVYDETALSLDADGTVFTASERIPVSLGWKAVIKPKQTVQQAESSLPNGLENGQTVTIDHIDTLDCMTTAPSAYTEGTLIGDMESIAKYIDDEKLKARLKETTGIGTSATRADIIETLKKRDYLIIKGKTIHASAAGNSLIAALPRALSSASETAIWEAQLDQIAHKQLDIDTFLSGLATQLKNHLAHIKTLENIPDKHLATQTPDTHLPCPDCGQRMWRRTNKKTGDSFLGCSGYPACKATLPIKNGKKAE